MNNALYIMAIFLFVMVLTLSYQTITLHNELVEFQRSEFKKRNDNVEFTQRQILLELAELRGKYDTPSK